MVTEIPACSDSAKFNSTQAAQILGIHRNTLRTHTKMGWIRFSLCRRTGRVYYTGRDVKRYWREVLF